MSNDTSPEVIKLVDKLDTGMKLVEMPVKTEGERNHVQEILNEALARNYTEVIVLGYASDKDQIEIKNSKTISTARLLGCIDIVKHHLLSL